MLGVFVSFLSLLILCADGVKGRGYAKWCKTIFYHCIIMPVTVPVLRLGVPAQNLILVFFFVHLQTTCIHLNKAAFNRHRNAGLKNVTLFFFFLQSFKRVS